MQLSDTGNRITKMKYSVDKNEPWEAICLRVASYMAEAEKIFGKTDEEVNLKISEFYQMIYGTYFIPGGRILANSGTGIKNLMNCYVLPVQDSRDSIYGTLKDAAEVFAMGGGIGYNFSHVREEGAPVVTTGGKASGPLSFLTLFDQTGEVISQASRRGAQMGMLNVNHKDIEKFIDFKAMPNSRNQRILDEYDRNLKYVNGTLKNTKYFNVLQKTLLDDQLTHFNISVVLTDDFMKKVLEDSDFDLESVTTDPPKTVNAQQLLCKIATQAHKSGDPGLFFKDRVNEDNMVPYIGELECTNPCGEVPLFPYESCDLGSINVYMCYDPITNTVDWETLEQITRLSTRFLDNVQEMSYTSLDKINEMCKGLRRLGLGVMGWADLLAEMGLAYDSPDAFALAEYISWFISFFAWQESIELAKERGPFKFYDADKVNLHVVEKVINNEKYNPYKFDMEEIRKTGLRNVSVTSIAPTGSIALVAGVNSAIEPFFALAYRRYVTEGVGNVAKETIVEVNPILFRKLIVAGLDDATIEEVKEYILKHGSIQGLTKVPIKIRNAFKTAHDLKWEDHLKMQASWQEYVSNAVSKTVNMPEHATVDDVYNCYMQAWDWDVKGLTIYRNNSRAFQILNVGTKE